MLAGILPPTEGDALVAGRSVRTQPEAVKDRIAYMSQRFGLYGDLTVLENLLFYADLFEVPRQERAPRIERLLGFSNLTPFKDRLADKLSGGMKQKLGLACALIHTPEILLLDEPTNGVDPVSRRDFWRILYEMLKEGVTILVTTAYLDEAERCNRVGLMHQGRLLALDAPRQIKSLMAGDLVEILVTEAWRAREVLAGVAGDQERHALRPSPPRCGRGCRPWPPRRPGSAGGSRPRAARGPTDRPLAGGCLHLHGRARERSAR